jgi:hypothetical protein
MKLAAQDIEKLLAIFLSYQSNPVLRQFALHAIAISDWDAYLPIDGEISLFRPNRNYDGDF